MLICFYLKTGICKADNAVLKLRQLAKQRFSHKKARSTRRKDGGIEPPRTPRKKQTRMKPQIGAD
jgi:hypothetical protein